MIGDYAEAIAQSLGFKHDAVRQALALMAEGATLPFIARYRKEETGGLYEFELLAIKETRYRIERIQKRREEILEQLQRWGKLTDELKLSFYEAASIAEAEDLFLPFSPNRCPIAREASEKGLDPLANALWDGEENPDFSALVPAEEDQPAINSSEALEGALKILAEKIAFIPTLRQRLRRCVMDSGFVHSQVIEGKEAESQRFSHYFDHVEPISKINSEHFLAIRRGENDRMLRWVIEMDREAGWDIVLEELNKAGVNNLTEYLLAAAHDAYDRLLLPSILREVAAHLKEVCETDARIRYAKNLFYLMMSQPYSGKRVMAVDPGFKTGCRVVVLDEEGNPIDSTICTIYPNPPKGEEERSAGILEELCRIHKVDAIALGNTAGCRETDGFLRRLRAEGRLGKAKIAIINSSGIHSFANSAAGKDDLSKYNDGATRRTISIGRRLQNMAYELLKISNPTEIVTGQYQQDLDQKKLARTFRDAQIIAVSTIGSDLNIAPERVLQLVAGIGPSLAKEIVEYRKSKGPFRNRQQLLEMPKFNARAYQQAAGFLRIFNSDHLLDVTGIHPDQYDLVDKIAADQNADVASLLGHKGKLASLDLSKYVVDNKVSLKTLEFIRDELARAGRDPRLPEEKPAPQPRKVKILEEFKEGEITEGTVTSICEFGAFIDIGAETDGLVHISEMAHTFVKDPTAIVKVGDKVKVAIIQLEKERRRLGLSIKQTLPPPPPMPPPSEDENRVKTIRRRPSAGPEKKEEPKQVPYEKEFPEKPKDQERVREQQRRRELDKDSGRKGDQGRERKMPPPGERDRSRERERDRDRERFRDRQSSDQRQGRNDNERTAWADKVKPVNPFAVLTLDEDGKIIIKESKKE